MSKRITIRTILFTLLWMAVGAGTTVLLVAAIQKKDEKHCKGVSINIEGVNNNYFVDKKDIESTIHSLSNGNPVGKSVGSVHLKDIEQVLQKNIWIKNVQLFFDNNEILQVRVLEREPVARVFTTTGTTFYLDSSLAMLPLSEKFSARLPVFTNFPSDKKVLLKEDSILLRGILLVSNTIQEDPFLMGMIDQVDITEHRTFDMVPKLGNTIIQFGDGKDVEEKFNKLELFYKEVIVKGGWNVYSAINVQYRNQVVGKRKDAKEVAADSIATLKLMKAIAENAERLSADSLQTIIQDNDHNSTNSNLIQQSIERDDNHTSSNSNEESLPQGPQAYEKPAALPASTPPSTKPVVNPPPRTTTVANKPLVPQPNTSVKPKQAGKQKPKVLMPKKEDEEKPVNEY